MYRVNVKCMIAAVILLAVLSGCGAKDRVMQVVGLGGPDPTVYSGPVYPATSKIATAFQADQVNRSCRVFAEVLVQLPEQFSGKDIESTILKEAGTRGADQVLIGQARTSTKNSGPTFLYYGPTYQYLCADQCGAWKYGYDLWEKQGEWVSVGYRQWGNVDVVYEMPIIMQVLMLRCR
ncbi:hypothetical protein [Desulfobulbus oligotrophicus]|uniref:Lipoprotein n=1 Tax=Desulfobulbus oligotrophicus TaxID=1909699 RepID=A0A7T5VBR6_9BACT|nr:hypothetical protein [Desulfobulbus oligotrophicus]QQG64964.1 hypothetical protein HP555_03330 [Desulfobulbus oligotrophicus]